MQIGEIETGIEIPSGWSRDPSPVRKAMEELEVGQSRLIKESYKNEILSHAHYIGKKSSRKFATRSVDTSDKSVRRVWRIE